MPQYQNWLARQISPSLTAATFYQKNWEVTTRNCSYQMFQKIQITLMMIIKNMCFKQLFNSIELASTLIIQNQPSRDVLRKRCSKNMQQIYRRTLMPKWDFNKVALQLHWNHTSAWVFSCNVTAYFQNPFF